MQELNGSFDFPFRHPSVVLYVKHVGRFNIFTFVVYEVYLWKLDLREVNIFAVEKQLLFRERLTIHTHINLQCAPSPVSSFHCFY